LINRKLHLLNYSNSMHDFEFTSLTSNLEMRANQAYSTSTPRNIYGKSRKFSDNIPSEKYYVLDNFISQQIISDMRENVLAEHDRIVVGFLIEELNKISYSCKYNEQYRYFRPIEVNSKM